MYHALHALGTGGNPFTDGGDIHLNGLISGMQIRSPSEIDAIQVFIPNLAHIENVHFLAIFRSVIYGDSWGSPGEVHGGSGGNPTSFELNPGAKIILVQDRQCDHDDQWSSSPSGCYVTSPTSLEPHSHASTASPCTGIVQIHNYLLLDISKT